MNTTRNLCTAVLLLIYVSIANVNADGPWKFELATGALTNLAVSDSIEGLYWKLTCYEGEGMKGDTHEYKSTEKGWTNVDKKDRCEKFAINKVGELGETVYDSSWWVSSHDNKFYGCKLELMEYRYGRSDKSWAESDIIFSGDEDFVNSNALYLYKPGSVDTFFEVSSFQVGTAEE